MNEWDEYEEGRVIEEMVCDPTSHPDLRADPTIDRMVRETRSGLGLDGRAKKDDCDCDVCPVCGDDPDDCGCDVCPVCGDDPDDCDCAEGDY